MSFIREVRNDIEREAFRLIREYHAMLVNEAKGLGADEQTAEDLAFKTIETYLGQKGQTLLYMFYCICLDECYWTPRQFARQFAHIPRQKVVRNADALAGVRFWFNTRICSRLTTLTFRGGGNLPRKPTRSSAKMV